MTDRHNYALESGEDSYIGAAIFGLRSTDGTLYPVAGHAIYTANLWVATDPRRQLRAICSGHPIDATWREVPFDLNLGSSMGTKELAKVYEENSEFLQGQDLASMLGNGFYTDKTYRNIDKIYKWAIENKGLPDEAIAFARDGYGLKSSVPESPEECPFAISDDLSEALTRCSGQRP